MDFRAVRELAVAHGTAGWSSLTFYCQAHGSQVISPDGVRIMIPESFVLTSKHNSWERCPRALASIIGLPPGWKTRA
jgi:hypothetical protein